MARMRRSFRVLSHVAATRNFATADTSCKTPDSLARNYLAAINKILKKNNQTTKFYMNLLDALECATHADLTAILKKAIDCE